MKTAAMIAAIGGVATILALGNAAPASASTFNFGFDTGTVAFAYSDGYWDNDHHWHKWHNAREAREYRRRFADHYTAVVHTRATNKGWRDRDGDGVPNKFDRAPDNPRRN